jgi:predicted SPOUT superfamily RNA methylase MTH1
MGMIDTKNEKHSKMTSLLPQEERKNPLPAKRATIFFQFSRAPKYLKKKIFFVKSPPIYIYVLPRLQKKKCKSNNGSNLVNKVYLMMD